MCDSLHALLMDCKWSLAAPKVPSARGGGGERAPGGKAPAVDPGARVRASPALCRSPRLPGPADDTPPTPAAPFFTQDETEVPASTPSLTLHLLDVVQH